MYSDIEKQRLKQELKHKSRMDNLKYKQSKKELRNNGSRLTYSKWIIVFLTSLLMVICTYAMVVMPIYKDFSPLTPLIAIIGSACLGAVVEYLWTSAKENTKGGVVHDTAMRDIDDEYEGEQ